MRHALLRHALLRHALLRHALLRHALLRANAGPREALVSVPTSHDDLTGRPHDLTL